MPTTSEPCLLVTAQAPQALTSMPAVGGPHSQNTSPFPSSWLVPNPGPACSRGWARCGVAPAPRPAFLHGTEMGQELVVFSGSTVSLSRAGPVLLTSVSLVQSRAHCWCLIKRVDLRCPGPTEALRRGWHHLGFTPASSTLVPGPQNSTSQVQCAFVGVGWRCQSCVLCPTIHLCQPN